MSLFTDCLHFYFVQSPSDVVFDAFENAAVPGFDYDGQRRRTFRVTVGIPPAVEFLDWMRPRFQLDLQPGLIFPVVRIVIRFPINSREQLRGRRSTPDNPRVKNVKFVHHHSKRSIFSEYAGNVFPARDQRVRIRVAQMRIAPEKFANYFVARPRGHAVVDDLDVFDTAQIAVSLMMIADQSQQVRVMAGSGLQEDHEIALSNATVEM